MEGFEAFGAHLCQEYGQEGARFTVYAPNAANVRLIGSFNGWEGYDMQRLPEGVWTIFAKDVKENDLYKFRIQTRDGEIHDRIDPFAFLSERRPDTASIVCRLDGFSWTDDTWMRARGKNYSAPMSVYELHAGSWKTRTTDGKERFYHYDELAGELLPYVKRMGYTHIELLPLTEHPYDGSWGYQVTGYYSATSRYGSPQQLMRLVNACHEQGIGVILDFVPVHFVKDFYALHQYDGGFLYESDQPENRESEWGTALFDFTKPHVLSFLKSAINFWITFYHLDGIRYDAVSNLLYNGGRPERGVNEAGVWFLKNTNYAIGNRHPGVMLIAEDSSTTQKVTAPVVYGGLGFDYKWNLGWMHDTLEYMALPPAQRPAHRDRFTHSMLYFYQDIFLLPFSHDEVVHGKKTIIDKLYGSYEEKFQQLRCLYLYMFTHPGKKLNFMGNELAEFKEWDEASGLCWSVLDYPAHSDFLSFFTRLQQFYLHQPALFREDYNMQAFRWLEIDSRFPCLFAYAREDLNGDVLIVLLNLSNQPCAGCRLPVGAPGRYALLFSTGEPSAAGEEPERQLTAKPIGGWCLEPAVPAYSGYVFKKLDTCSDPEHE